MTRKRRTHPGPYLLYINVLRDRIVDPDQYPFSLPVIRHLTTLDFHPKVTFLVGENGTGKSTLLEALAVACGMNPEGGGRNFNFTTRDSHSSLGEYLELARAPALMSDTYFLRAESFFNLATQIESLDVARAYGGSLHERSHGESFFALFKNRMGSHGLYLMDEPEAALSPKRQIEFLGLLHDFVKRGCQFVIATHSPIIMAYPDARIYLLGNDGIRIAAYTETEHYLVTRGFLVNPEIVLSALDD